MSEYGKIHIEAHAYSTPVSQESSQWEAQIARYIRDPDLCSLLICSPGHDAFRKRFPGTCMNALAVGMLDQNGVLLGSGPLRCLVPDIVLPAQSLFPARTTNGGIDEVGGTSPAVCFVAGIAALLAEKFNLNRDDLVLILHYCMWRCYFFVAHFSIVIYYKTLSYFIRKFVYLLCRYWIRSAYDNGAFFSP